MTGFFFSTGDIYEEAAHHNAVFVGRDESGIPRYAHQRGTAGSFRLDVKGSDKAFNFCYRGEGERLFVFEAPIDLLSFLCLFKKDWQKQSYLALGGVGEKAPAGAITCIVDEDTIKVKSIQTIPVEMVVSQTYSFLEDVGADCIKTGMLYSQELVTAIGNVVKKQSIPIVVDPVMVSSAGDKLLQDDAIQAYKDCLFPYSTIITPNRREADLLLGKSLTKDNMKEYIPELSKWGNCVIVKSIEDGDYLIDVFYNPISKCFKLYKKARIQTKNVNGTGDTFASSIATYLARGYDMNTAVDKAENFIYNAILYGSNVKFGSGYGPVYPFYENLSNFLKEDIQYAAAIQVEQYIL